MATAESTATPKTRIERARALVAAGGIARRGGVHEVRGKGGTYEVCLHAETCACPAGARRVPCYHLLAVEIYEAAARAAVGAVKVHEPLTPEERAARLAALEQMAV